MKKKQLEKVRKEFESMDLSHYHILTYDELLKVNGGSGNDSDDNDDEESEDNDKSDGLSGAKFYVQGGADIAPMFQFGGEYSKEIIHATPFDLPSYDYEFKPIADVNTTGNLTFPLGGFGSITINTAETIDFFTKAFDF